MLTNRIAIIYAVVLAGFGLSIYFILECGQNWKTLRTPIPSLVATPSLDSRSVPQASHESAPPGIESSFLTNLREPRSMLFSQLILIISAARTVGSVFVKWGQPAVIGEMVAGILLGPSLLGWAFPATFHFVFTGSSLDTLKMLSQIGVCLFLFLVGMELDVNLLRQKAPTAVLVSHASILLPYFLGVALAVFLYADFAAPGTPFVSFALFMGISLSITAFPVLARILEERGLSKTILGATALTCAAVDDVTAWNLLAVVVAIAKNGGLTASLIRLVLVLGFVAIMLFGVRKKLCHWLPNPIREGMMPGKGVIAGMLIFVLASALMTEIIGINALFGAFLAGVVMPPQPAFREFLKVRLENFSSTFLLPLFFAFTGLRTQISLLNDAESWLICLGIILVATLGKWGGSMLAARFTGMNWRDSFALGALMNTRGLMELIALNLGYDLGILSPRIFAMLVIMALATTCLTGPLLTLAQSWKTRPALAPGPA